MRIVRNLVMAAVALGFVATVAAVLVNGLLQKKTPPAERTEFAERPPSGDPPPPPVAERNPIPVVPPVPPPANDLERAVAAAKNGKFADAKTYLEKEVARGGPDSPDAAQTIQTFCTQALPYAPLAELYVASGRTDSAFESLLHEVLRRSNPDENDTAKLLDLFEKRHPDDPRLLLAHAGRHFRRGEYDKADAAFDRAAAAGKDVAFPDPALVRGQRIECRFQLDKAESALRDFEPAAETFEQLARLSRQWHKLDVLDRLISERLKKGRDDDLLDQLCLLRMDQGRAEDAVAIYRERMKLGKKDADFLTENFAYWMGERGLSAAAYQELRERGGHWWRVIAGPQAETAKVIALRRKDVPDDPEIPLLMAALLHRRRAYAKEAAILDSVWPRLSDDEKKSRAVMNQYVFGHAGNWKKALEVDDKYAPGRVLRSLSRSGHWKEIAELLDARESTIDPKEVALWRLRLRVRAGKIDPVEPMTRKLPFSYETNEVVDEFDAAGRLMDAFRVLGPLHSVHRITELLLERGKIDEAERLLRDADDIGNNLIYPRAQVLLARGRSAEAEALLATFYKIGPGAFSEGRPTGYCALALTCRVRSGRTVETYVQSGCADNALSALAAICMMEKRPDELARLFAVSYPIKTDFDPKAVLRANTTEAMLAGLLYLRGDDKAFLSRSETMDRDFMRCREIDSLRVRSLVRLDRREDAVALAESLMSKDYEAHVLDYLRAHLGWDDPQEMIAAVDRCADDEELLAYAYADPEIGARLRSQAFGPFRKKYPEPK